MSVTITVPRTEVEALIARLLDHEHDAHQRAGYAAGTLEYWLCERRSEEMQG